MWLTKWIELTWGSPNEELLIGFYNQAYDGYPIDENGEPKLEEEPLRINRFVIGFLLFNIAIFYR